MNYILLIFSLIFSTACVSNADGSKPNPLSITTSEVSTIKTPVEKINYTSYLNITILSSILLSAFLILRRQNKLISEIKTEIKNLGDQPKTIVVDNTQKSEPTPKTAVNDVKNETLDELSKSLAQAMNEISKRDATINNLTANVTRSNIQNNLVRLTQTLDIACLIQTRLANGKSNANESIEFIIDDIKSALNGQGVEFSEIKPGTRVADLPAGSFAAISVVDAPNESLKGTVKEVRSLCYFINEENKKPRYIAAAKVILYRA